MKVKRIALLDLSALARAASGSPARDDGAEEREPRTPPSRCTQCGTAMDHGSPATQLDDPTDPDADDDFDPLAIEIALDWARAKSDRTRRTAFERTLLRTLQLRLRRNAARSARRRTWGPGLAARRRG